MSGRGSLAYSTGPEGGKEGGDSPLGRQERETQRDEHWGLQLGGAWVVELVQGSGAYSAVHSCQHRSMGAS